MGGFIAILAVIGILFISTRKWNDWSTKNLKYKRFLDKDRVFVGERVRITTEIVNRKLLPLPWIEVHAEIPKEFSFEDQKVTRINENSKKIYRVVTSLFSFQRVKRHNLLYCSKRGFYSAYDVHVSIGDFLGLSVAEKYVEHPIHLIVYPEIKPLEDLIVPYVDPQGEISVRRWIMPDPMEIVGARKYTPRDSFNTIDWNTTAKIGELYVKKYDFTANPSIMTILNVQTEKIHWQGVNEEYIEKGIEIIAAITERAIKEKVPLGYTANSVFKGEHSDIFVDPSLGNNKKVILEALAKTSYYRGESIEDLARIASKRVDRGSVLMLLTAYVSKELVGELNYLAKRDYRVKIILLNNNADTSGLDKTIEVILSNDKRLLTG